MRSVDQKKELDTDASIVRIKEGHQAHQDADISAEPCDRPGHLIFPARREVYLDVLFLDVLCFALLCGLLGVCMDLELLKFPRIICFGLLIITLAPALLL